MGHKLWKELQLFPRCFVLEQNIDYISVNFFLNELHGRTTTLHSLYQSQFNFVPLSGYASYP